MNAVQHRIKCGNCKGDHATTGEVRDCYRGVRPAQVPAATVASKVLAGRVGQPGFVTEKQYKYIIDLGGDPNAACWYTSKGASLAIERLKRGGNAKVSTSPQEPNTRRSTKIPLDFLRAIKEGYYASRPDSMQDFTFFRISFPNRGNFKGTMKIQTQHGPDLKLYMVVYPDDRVYKYSDYSKYEDDLMLVAVDQRGCGIAYAEKIGNCMRCNTELTDPRSRWYGIGPECEKHWPEIIEEINDIKGVFKHGAGE